MARAPFRLGLTRDQLASFLQDFEQIKQFENLFQLVDEEVAPNSVTEATTLAGNANARAQQALDTLERIANTLDALAAAPVEENNNSITTDYIDYNLNVPAPTPYVGRTFWDGGQTLNVQQTLNVAGKVNEDNYYNIKADSTILKGELVMFTGAVGSSGVLRGAPATGLGISDGVRLMGIAAEDIATNGFGLVQWSGTLKGFDTTGTPYGETWADGDILYYNPAFAGGLTKNEPIAPNVRAVVAAVVNAGSGGSGSVVIRLSVGSVLGGTDSNVYINSLANDDLLQYDGVQQRWENHAASSVTVGAATNVAGGAANQIVYQTGIGATGFIVAPTIASTFLQWNGTGFQWAAVGGGTGTVTSVDVSGGTTGLTFSGGPITTSGTITMAGTLDVDNGGTGQTTYTNGQLLIGNSTGNTLTKSTLTAGTGISISNGAGSITITNSAPDQIVSLTGAGTTVITGAYPSFTITSNDQFVGTVTSIDVSGGTTGLTFSGGPITTNGTITMAGTLDADNGGTGQSSYVIGDILYASSTTALSRLADVATGNALISGGIGVAPLWGKIGLTTHVSGTLPVANGGTGTSTAFTQGSIIFAGPSGVYAQDNSQLFWNDTTDNLSIGTTSSLRGARLTVKALNQTLTSGFGQLSLITSDAVGLDVGASLVLGGQTTPAADFSFATISGRSENNSYAGYFSINTSRSTGSVPERVRVDSSGFTQFLTNLVMPYQPAQTTKAAAATLTGAELITGILQYTGGAATVNFPTGANIEGALTWVANNVALDFFVINTGAGTCTMGANGNTTVGVLTVATNTSAQFRIRRTAVNTFTIYRLG